MSAVPPSSSTATASHRLTGAKRSTASLLIRRHNTRPVALAPAAVGAYLSACKRPGGPDTGPVLVVPLDTHRSVGPVVESTPATTCATAAVADGLAAKDILIVGRDAASAEDVTQWTYLTAARHALAGGRVVLVYAPGSGGMQLQRFAGCVEALVVGQSVPTATDAAEAGYECGTEGVNTAHQTLPQQQHRVLAALGRVDAVHCHTIEELYAFCAAYNMPAGCNVGEAAVDPVPSASSPNLKAAVPPSAATTTATVATDTVNETALAPRSRLRADKYPRRSRSPAADVPAPPTVPLIIVEGCGGEDSYVHRYERAACCEVPLRHWLLCLLQRRTRCALVLVESTGAAQHQRLLRPLLAAPPEAVTPVSAFGSPPSLQAEMQQGLSAGVARSVARESDVAARLLAPHTHHAPAPLMSAALRARPRPPPLVLGSNDDNVPAFLRHIDVSGVTTISSFTATATHAVPTLTLLQGGAAPAAVEEQRQPVADVGGYAIAYMLFGSAIAGDSAVESYTAWSAVTARAAPAPQDRPKGRSEPAMLVAALSSRYCAITNTTC